MIIPEYTIPSSFLQTDDHVTAADSFVNVRDVQRYRLNHNILLAQGIRRELFSIVFNDSINDSPVEYVCRNRVGNAGVQPIFWLGQVLVSQWTAEVELVFRAAKAAIGGGSGFSGDPAIKAKLFPDPGLPNSVGLQSVDVTSASGTAATYRLTLPVPHDRSAGAPWFGMDYYWLVVYMDTPVDNDTAKESNRTVLDSGIDWVDLNSGSSYVDHVLWVDNDATFSPRQIVASETVAGGNRHWVDKPMDRMLDAGTDTVTISDIQGIEVYSMSAYEKPVTDLTQRDAPL